MFVEKTQPFHLKIEQKQKELQPWTAQITVKQSEINNATSEREALAKRAEQVKESCAAAEEELANLEEHLSSKVRFYLILRGMYLMGLSVGRRTGSVEDEEDKVAGGGAGGFRRAKGALKS